METEIQQIPVLKNDTPSEPPDSLSWTDQDWKPIVAAIRGQRCTPFLGAGASAHVLPLGSAIARRWAQSAGYPFGDAANLPRVAQYRAVRENSMTVKLELQAEFANTRPPDFDNESEPHRVVTDLRLPLYITTNYDRFILDAMEHSNRREPGRARTPRSVICPWHLSEGELRRQRSRRNSQASPEVEATPDAPLIFHMHGRIDMLDSMVLTEDDYLDFLMRISEDQDLMPPRVEEAFASSSLLFLGYSLEDMNFKVIFRKLASYMRRAEGARHVSVQLAPTADQSGQPPLETLKHQREYLETHFNLQHVKIYWGSCQSFASELRKRLNGS
jgi:hypothetical protein